MLDWVDGRITLTAVSGPQGSLTLPTPCLLAELSEGNRKFHH